MIWILDYGFGQVTPKIGPETLFEHTKVRGTRKMSSWQKLVGAGLVLGIFACLLWTACYRRAELSWRAAQPPMTAAEGQPITVVMLSYAHARRENQLALIGHYGNHPLVDRFLWVWNSPVNATKLRAALPRTKGANSFGLPYFSPHIGPSRDHAT
jgi:hypothetical protein